MGIVGAFLLVALVGLILLLVGVAAGISWILIVVGIIGAVVGYFVGPYRRV
jgi:hypothetical protein